MADTLVYCGLNRCGSFDKLQRKFAVCYGFEAIPELAAKAAERYQKRSGVHIVNAALTESDGPVKFNVHDDDAASSIGKLGDEYREKTRNDIQVTREIEVPGINLFNFLQSKGVERIDLYVSDIQGLDLAVLKTLKPYLDTRRIKRIICETERDAHAFEAYEGVPTNRQSDFMGLLDKNYVVVKRQRVYDHWVSQDITWRLRLPHLWNWYRGRFV